MQNLGAINKIRLFTVLFVALLLRGVVFFQVIEDPRVVMQPDSGIYLSLAQGLIQNGSFSNPDSPDYPDPERMPGYPLFLASIMWVFQGNLLAAVLIQILLDSLSCLLICYLGELICRGSGFLSGILAALNMGMITYSHFILTDSLFLFVSILVLLMLLRVSRRRELKSNVFLGALLGIAVLIRPVIMYLPVLLIPLLFVCFITKLHVPAPAALGKVLLIGLIFVCTLSPWLIRNFIHFGRFQLSSQSGVHLLQYVVPFVWQYSKGVPFLEGMEKARHAFKERAEKEGLDLIVTDPFERSDLKVKMAVEYLRQEPKSAILKAWIFGGAKNLFSPAIIDLSYLLRVKRPHFFYTKGTTFLERAWNFLKGMQGFFGWAVIENIIALVLSRLIQVWGLVILLRHKTWEAVFLTSIILYFLVILGPVGYAKYRLPVEPLLIVLLSIGIRDLYTRFFASEDRVWGMSSKI